MDRHEKMDGMTDKDMDVQTKIKTCADQQTNKKTKEHVQTDRQIYRQRLRDVQTYI